MADLKMLAVVIVALVLKNGAHSCSLHSHTSTSTFSSVPESTSTPQHTSPSCGPSDRQCADGLNQIASIPSDSTPFTQYSPVPVSPVSVPSVPVTPLSSSFFNYDQLSNNYLSNYLSFPPLPIAPPVSLPFPSSSLYDSSQPLSSFDSPAHRKPLVFLFMPDSASSEQWSLDRSIPSSQYAPQQITIPTSIINVPDIQPASVPAPAEVLSPAPETTTTSAGPVSNSIPISAPISPITNSTDIAAAGPTVEPTSGSLSQSAAAPALSPESDSINTSAPPL